MNALERAWYRRGSWAVVLQPLSLLFALISGLRRWAFRRGWLASYRAPVPVLVVGNITVGGAGKTPTTILLCQLAETLGIKVGVVSRGYGGHSEHYPCLVDDDSQPEQVGDEPLLIHLRTTAAVMVDPVRARAAQRLVELGCQLIIADDGLQHYRLQRDAEVIVIDGERRLGNGWLLPAGPLRESPRRLSAPTVAAVICNGGRAQEHELAMQLVAETPRRVRDGVEVSLAQDEAGAALAGIGHPPRFFSLLQRMGYRLEQRFSLADHRQMEGTQLTAIAARYPWLMMTEKDAVKYRHQAPDNCCYLPVSASLTDSGYHQLQQLLNNLMRNDRHGL